MNDQSQAMSAFIQVDLPTPEVASMIAEIEALTTEVDEHRELFKQLFPSMFKAFGADKRKHSVKFWHANFQSRLGDVHIRVFRIWWKAEHATIKH